MKTLIAGVLLSLAAALAPVPRIAVQNPKLLYAAAMYKTAVGDNVSALRLVQRAEAAQQPPAAPADVAGSGARVKPCSATPAGVRIAVLTIL